MQKQVQCDILIGATGWNHPAWVGSYYPEDLPEDWRLSYYSNELNTVLVPESDWTNKNRDDIEEWIDETHDEFIFYFELSLSSCLKIPHEQSLASIIRSLNNDLAQIGGLLITVAANATEADLLTATTNIPQGLAINFDFDKSPFSEEQRQAISTKLNINTCWQPEQSAKNPQISGQMYLGRLKAETAHANEQLKNYFEQFRSNSNKSSECALFLYGHPPDINNLHNIQLIKELILG